MFLKISIHYINYIFPFLLYAFAYHNTCVYIFFAHFFAHSISFLLNINIKQIWLCMQFYVFTNVCSFYDTSKHNYIVVFDASFKLCSTGDTSEPSTSNNGT